MNRVFEHPRARAHKGFLLPFAALFAEQLRARGYAPGSVKASSGLVKDFAVWFDQRGFENSIVSCVDVTEYLAERWRRRRRRRGDAFTLRSFVGFAVGDGIATEPTPLAASTPARQLLQQFEQYLQCERGLAAASIRLYSEAVGRFLAHTFGDRQVRLDELGAAEVVRFVQVEAARLRHAKRAKVMTTALRSFLRFGRYRGEIVGDLHACVPTVANWSMAGIPRTILASQVDRLLASCDRRTANGRRDHAMLLLMARLGLRAGEVVDLQLEDLDWDEGVIRIRGPAQRCDQLPLPADVGAALAEYLHEARPASSARNVFIRARAPRTALRGPSAVSCVVARALQRAGIDAPTKGAHLLRHSLATQMLGGGASLAEIAEILRHRNPQTTTIYAKVDLASLGALALPWPGGAR